MTDPVNWQGVGLVMRSVRRGEQVGLVTVLWPSAAMSAEEAMIHAAWLVEVASVIEGAPEWEAVRAAVRGT